MKEKILKVKILGRERLNNSYSGNPAWRLFLESEFGSFFARTASDAACGYSVSNYKIGSTIEIQYHTTRNGTDIIDYINEVA